MAELDCPASLYGMALAEPLQLSRSRDGFFIFFFEHVRIWGLLFMNYSIQLLFVFELWQMEVPSEEHHWSAPIACDQRVALLEFVCIFVFEVAMFNEVKESAGIFRILWNAAPAAPPPDPKDEKAKKHGWMPAGFSTKTDKKDERKHTAQGAILTEVHEQMEVKRSFMDRMRGRKKLAVQEGFKPWSLNGMSRKYKLLMLFVVALPKLVLGVFLAYIGGWYIMDSQDKETLILNTLAVTFIVDINKFLFIAFTSPSVQENLDHMDHIQIEVKNTYLVMHWFLNAIVYPILVVVLSGALTMKFKYQACLNYDPGHDVQTTVFGSFSAFFNNVVDKFHR